MEHIPAHANESAERGQYLYHMVPDDMQGSELHPLNVLHYKHPELFVSKASKYADRLHIMEQFIPTLGAAWNDVLHFTAIHPKEIKQALIDAGLEPKEMKFYQIDPALLDPKNTTIYLYSDKTGDAKMAPENFTEYKPEELGTHAVLSDATKQYYKDQAAKGNRPLLFIGVPHILHKGSIDVSNLPVVTV